MNKNLLLIIAFFTCQFFMAQSAKDSIYSFQAVEIKPSFPGGIQFFNQFIAENFVIPNDTLFKGGKMLVDFVIDTTGTVSNVRVLRDIGFGTADQAKVIFPFSEKWLPGKQNGKKVKVRYGMPVILPPHESMREFEANTYNLNTVDQAPGFPGGMEEFYKILMRNYHTPNIEGLKGKIFASFVIDIDGTLTNERIIRDIGYGTGTELLRVLKLSPKWIPGVKDGKPVCVLYSIPINIQGPGR